MNAKNSLLVMLIMLAALFSLASCESMGNGEVMEGEANTYNTPPPTPPPAPLANLSDFEDVRIPGFLTVDRDASFVYESDSVKAGTLNLYGGTTSADVLDFFQANMPMDGWNVLSSFKYRKNVLLFNKPNKVCLIIVEPPGALTDLHAEVWVAPVRPGQGNIGGTAFDSRPIPNSYSGAIRPGAGRQAKLNSMPPVNNMPREETLPNNIQ